MSVGSGSLNSLTGLGNGSVARKIALFQQGPSTNIETNRLRRKDAIKRKKSPASLSSDSDNLSSPASSDSYGSSTYRDPGSETYDDTSSASIPLEAELTRVRLNERRALKDAYQSFTLPHGSRQLQLVEFTEVGLGSEFDPDEEPFYEELDLYVKNGKENEVSVSVNGNCLATCSAVDLPRIPKDVPDSVQDEDNRDGEGSPTLHESLYSEPIYGGAASSTGSSSYWTPTPSLYGGSMGTSKTLTTPDPCPKILLNNNANQVGLPRPRAMSSIDLQQGSASSNYGMRPELPPLPANPSKFSSIAKSAGKRIAKKLQYIRRSSLDHFEVLSSTFVPSRGSSTSLSLSSRSGTPVGGSRNGHAPLSLPTEPAAPMTRSISRPTIPPPAPPPQVRCQPTAPLPPLPPVPTATISICPREEESAFGDEDEDFDDSDFYESDSELIRNFVAAVQPIYSMEEEPLYQYYSYGISSQPEDDYQPVIPKNLGLTLDMLVPRMGQRTLWCEIPEVQTSGILTILSDKQKQLQEAIFEILSSEVSYLKSLDVLITLFYHNQELIQLLSEEDRAALFGNITFVKDCAQAFLTELLAKWEESWYIQEVGKVINSNAESRFSVYKDYCRNKPYQDKTLQRLRQTSDEFVNVVKSIEEDPKCQLLRMDSFLMLPMQRITRLPLLVNAIVTRTQSVKERSECEEALKSLTNLVLECNEAARESQDAEETAAIIEKLEFPRTLKSISSPGQFVLKGDFMKNPFDSGRGGKLNWTFQKNKRTFFWLILFTNQLFITKKRGSGKLEVLDMISPKESHIKPLPNLEGISKDFQHYFMLHFEGRETVYFLAGRTQSEVDRWKLKIEELKARKDLTVEAIFPYEAKRKDELSFDVGDFIQVTQMQPDGWYFGTKRGTTGTEGWFPGNYCAEI